MQFLKTLLNKKTTTISTITPGEWFTSKEHYLEFTAAFKKAAQLRNLSSSHFALYAILRNRDWKKGWTYPKNPGKQVEHIYKKSLCKREIQRPSNEGPLLQPFDGTITTEMLMTIRENLEELMK